MRLRSICIGFFTAGVIGLSIEACSSTPDHPAPDSVGGGEAGTFDGSSGGGGGPVDSGDVDAAACHDTMKNGAETDTDCGGGTCPACALGKACVADPDCADGAQCENKLCALCHDGKRNGDETDVDCGGKACGPCTVGKGCFVPLDCKSAVCTGVNGTTEGACACPPSMQSVSLAAAAAGITGYCIDTAEVSKAQYNQFITANVPVTTQAAPCLAANTTFVPRGAWPPATSPGPLAFNFGLPVHYVDWCDAAAYCKWAKKEMCGAIGGGEVAAGAGADPTKSAWYNACSAQGTKTFPYGAVPYDAARCNGNGTGASGPNASGENPGDRTLSFGYTANQDDGVYEVAASDATGVITNAAHIACQGGSTGVYQMSGNVAEWENSCDDQTATSNCQVRGGSYADNDNATALNCTATRSVQRMPPVTVPDPLKDVGIRCCLY